MVVLGLLLVLIALVVGGDLALTNTHAVSGHAFGQSLSSVSLGGFFLAGAVTALVFALGVAMLFSGMARRRRRRLARRAVVNEHRAAAEGLAGERDQLAAQLERERAARQEAEARMTRGGARSDAGEGAAGREAFDRPSGEREGVYTDRGARRAEGDRPGLMDRLRGRE